MASKTNSILLGTLLTLTEHLGIEAVANTKTAGSFGSPNKNAVYSYAQIKDFEYAFAVISNNSSVLG